jgi:sugar/nucleoside kinase (ribokinase family)
MRLLAIGEVMVDVIAADRRGGAGPLHAPASILVGGTPVNAALAARRLGEQATVAGRVGDDDAAAFVRAALVRAGIDARLVPDPALPTGVFISVGDAIVASRGANDALDARDVEPLPEHDALLVSGYTLGAETAAAAGAALSASGARWRAVDAGGASDMPAEANVLFANEEETARLTGLEPEPAALALAREREVVVVKLGQRGGLAASRGEVVRAAPAQREPHGRIGAGDALDAGVLVGLGRGLPLADALALGVAAAAAWIAADGRPRSLDREG